jgi:organic hydroperoxide reductase OsmC/OhrA
MASVPTPKNCWHRDITLEKVGQHFAISKSHVDLLAQVPDANQSIYEAAIKAAETGCPVSGLFKVRRFLSMRGSR